MATSITFQTDNQRDEKVLQIANELNELEKRGSSTNALRVFIEENAPAKIERLRAEKVKVKS